MFGGEVGGVPLPLDGALVIQQTLAKTQSKSTQL